MDSGEPLGAGASGGRCGPHSQSGRRRGRRSSSSCRCWVHSGCSAGMIGNAARSLSDWLVRSVWRVAQIEASNGAMEVVRTLRVARQPALKARTQAVNELRALVVAAPHDMRTQLRRPRVSQPVTTAAAFVGAQNSRRRPQRPGGPSSGLPCATSTTGPSGQASPASARTTRQLDPSAEHQRGAAALQLGRRRLP